MRNITLLGHILFGINACVHPQPGPASVDVDPEVPEPPDWVGIDCIEQAGSYYFVGYGEGDDSASAIRSALISSRQNALTCIFGGTINSVMTIAESNDSVTYQGSTEVRLSYDHVNWSGYEQVPGGVFYANPGRTNIYARYRWASTTITTEKQRLAKLAAKIEETKALKQEVALKKAVITEQKLRLAQLETQEQELAAIKNAADRAVKNLKKLQKLKKEKDRDIYKVVSELYCGITVGELIEVFREPDKIVEDHEYMAVSDLEFYWGQYMIKVQGYKIDQYLGGAAMTDSPKHVLIKGAKNHIIEFVYVNFGIGNRGYKVCDSD